MAKSLAYPAISKEFSYRELIVDFLSEEWLRKKIMTYFKEATA